MSGRQNELAEFTSLIFKMTKMARYVTRDPVGSKKLIKLPILSADDSWPAFIRMNCFPSYAYECTDAGFSDEITNNKSGIKPHSYKQYGDDNLASIYKTKSIYVPKRGKGFVRKGLIECEYREEEFLP